jgi:hypothetical protein
MFNRNSSPSFFAVMVLAVVCVLCMNVCFADNCSNVCKNRQWFYVCPVGGAVAKFIEYENPDCLNCVTMQGALGGGRCEIASDYSNNPCIPSGTNRWRWYNDGNLKCDCGGNAVWFVEAQSLRELATEYGGIGRHVCQANNEPGGG